jgi:hypothetical protein
MRPDELPLSMSQRCERSLRRGASPEHSQATSGDCARKGSPAPEREPAGDGRRETGELAHGGPSGASARCRPGDRRRRREGRGRAVGQSEGRRSMVSIRCNPTTVVDRAGAVDCFANLANVVGSSHPQRQRPGRRQRSPRAMARPDMAYKGRVRTKGAWLS